MPEKTQTALCWYGQPGSEEVATSEEDTQRNSISYEVVSSVDEIRPGIIVRRRAAATAATTAAAQDAVEEPHERDTRSTGNDSPTFLNTVLPDIDPSFSTHNLLPLYLRSSRLDENLFDAGGGEGEGQEGLASSCQSGFVTTSAADQEDIWIYHQLTDPTGNCLTLRSQLDENLFDGGGEVKEGQEHEHEN